MKTNRQIAEEIVNKLEPTLLQKYIKYKESDVFEIRNSASVFLERWERMVATIHKSLDENNKSEILNNSGRPSPFSKIPDIGCKFKNDGDKKSMFDALDKHIDGSSKQLKS